MSEVYFFNFNINICVNIPNPSEELSVTIYEVIKPVIEKGIKLNRKELVFPMSDVFWMDLILCINFFKVYIERDFGKTVSISVENVDITSANIKISFSN